MDYGGHLYHGYVKSPEGNATFLEAYLLRESLQKRPRQRLEADARLRHRKFKQRPATASRRYRGQLGSAVIGG